MGEEYHIARKSVKVPVAELEWSLASGRESLSGLPHHRKPARNGFAEVERIIHHLPWEYPTMVLSLSMVDNSVFSPKRLTILIDPAYSPFIRKLSMPHISSSEDLYGPSCVLVPVRVLPHTLSGAALASLPAPSSAFPLKSRGYAHHSPASPQATHPT